MRRRRIISFGVCAPVLFLCWYSITGYQRGRADFGAVSEGRAPVYATHYAYLLDGGSEWFRGRGYSVYRMHFILLAHGNNPPEGYLGGARLEWSLPIRVFADGDDSYHYIPDAAKRPNKGAAANRRSVSTGEWLCGSWSFLTGHQAFTAAIAELLR